MAEDNQNFAEDKIPQPKTIDEFLEALRPHYSEKDVDTVAKAYAFSEKAHEGQIRRSGEPYIFHPLSVSYILSELHLDVSTIITGLLHDTVEDTDVTLEDVKREFGENVAHLVDGVTKISQISFRNTHTKQGENIRKMIVAMGKDIRVIIVKLADRLHNMRTLNHMPYEKQARIAQETLDIYAPLANRLGINEWKIELEDLSFRYLKPDVFYDLAQKVSKKKKEREKYVDDVRRMLSSEIKNAKLKAEVQGRPKHLYSIYKKMTLKNIEYDEVYDVLAFRVVVDSIAQCYEVLGLVHSIFRPIPGRFKDYIAMAKTNNYQSLHTTVFGPGGERIEIQIRTHDMHLIAERGIAAHWLYKEGEGKSSKKDIVKFEWLKNLMDWNKETRDSDEFLENVKSDLFDSEIYVFTPKGDVKELPDGSTPLDFAYSVHTDVGNKTVGAKIDGRIVPLKYKLKNGDTIDIMTSPHQKPSKDWLKFCVTTRAKSKIRAFIRTEERRRSIALGRELLDKEFRKHGFKLENYENTEVTKKFLKDVGAVDIEELLAQVAYGKQMPIKVIERMVPDFKVEKVVEDENDTSFLGRMFRSNKKKKARSIIRVDGMSDLLVHYAKCCNPIPGDPILGFISRGRGVTIHQASCPKAFEIDQARMVDVEWTNADVSQERITKVRVYCHDIPGLLKLMSETFTANGVNIHNAQIRTNSDKKSICVFDVVVRDASQLTQTLQNLEKIKGVISAERIHFA
ncbi:MAG: bifunctional (p)ppGpp synthetase/guanosine-3',5'-bis(diphosphate) 3'-pyrophosphohydrolase [Bdellovibrionales bacterium]|nr:bifunctional (p)ppGpp synthetase/guanosine-3',5'-bis(diphosphate) 3'-pyrophosphohydrolase [Bdellovibrionales bacterium]